MRTLKAEKNGVGSKKENTEKLKYAKKKKLRAKNTEGNKKKNG